MSMDMVFTVIIIVKGTVYFSVPVCLFDTALVIVSLGARLQSFLCGYHIRQKCEAVFVTSAGRSGQTLE